MKRKIIIAVAAVLLLGLCFTAPVVAADGTNVEYRSIEEIKAYVKDKGASPNNSVTYDITPSIIPPYNPGTLSPLSQLYALRMLNEVRYIAGIDADIIIEKEYADKAQACALVNAANNKMTHYPERPPGMNDVLYDLGYAGAQRSNIAMGLPTLNGALISGWMSDDDSINIVTVGHRRWVLNPRMSATGFGKVNSHTAMYAFDMKRTSAYKGVAWPAQTMPVQLFANRMPWSISMGYNVPTSGVQVTLTRLKDNKTWIFSDPIDSTGPDGYFNVNNGGYGAVGCIIFRPAGITYSHGDKFNVSITGAGTPINYNVEFFDLATTPPTITVAKPLGIKAKAGKKQMTVSWKKQSSAQGYQLLYATNKSFTKGKKTVNITKNTTVKKTIKKLKKGKVYYVKVRAYKIVDGFKIYGSYSKRVSCKVK